MSPFSGLDHPCGTCARPAGDHTLREWTECMGQPSLDLPFEAQSPDTAAYVADQVRKRFEVEADIIVADHVLVRAMTLAGDAGPLGVKLPAVLHEFQVGVAGQAPTTVAKVLFLADVDGMRAYGRLARDSANGAVNAAEKA